MKPDTIQVGKWTFCASIFRLQRDQEVIKLEPRVAQLLSYLTAHAGNLINRKTLLEEVWPGMVVGDEALTNAINKLRKAFKDDRQHPQVIETIPKAGYRLIAEVKPVSPRIPLSANNGMRQWISRKLLMLLAMVLAMLIFVLWALSGSYQQNVLPLTKPVAILAKPSIAVLPFDNLSKNAAQDNFTDGVTDDIITRLAKKPELVVVARDASFYYRNKVKDFRVIAEKLHVTHILNGSVRREGEKLIINAQLVEVTTGTHTWAEQYLRPVDDLLEVEKEIAQSVTAALLAHYKD